MTDDKTKRIFDLHCTFADTLVDWALLGVSNPTSSRDWHDQVVTAMRRHRGMGDHHAIAKEFNPDQLAELMRRKTATAERMCGQIMQIDGGDVWDRVMKVCHGYYDTPHVEVNATLLLIGHKDRFGKNPALFPLTNVVQNVQDLFMADASITDANDMRGVLETHFRDVHGTWVKGHVLYNSAIYMMPDEQHAAMLGTMRERRAGKAPLIPTRPIKPDDIKLPSGANVEFQLSTRTAGSGLSTTESLGSAGRFARRGL